MNYLYLHEGAGRIAVERLSLSLVGRLVHEDGWAEPELARGHIRARVDGGAADAGSVVLLSPIDRMSSGSDDDCCDHQGQEDDEARDELLHIYLSSCVGTINPIELMCTIIA